MDPLPPPPIGGVPLSCPLTSTKRDTLKKDTPYGEIVCQGRYMFPQARGMVVNLPRCGFIAASPNPNLTWVIGRPLCCAHLPLRVPPFCFYRFHSGGVLASTCTDVHSTVEELSQARAWSYSPPGSNEAQIRMPLFQTSHGGSVWRNWFDSVFRT